MAINIPMPELGGHSLLEGIDTGSSMFSRLMQPVLEREKAKQLEQQFQEKMAFNKEKAALAQQNFLKELALHQAAAARAGANSDLQRALLQEHLKQARNASPDEKEIANVKKDLPTLNKSYKGVNELLDIAKNNPDMFGHSFMPDLYAKTTNSKSFGRWQNLLSDAIAGLEQKLSSRGNVTALKMASQLKPSHAEQQQVAIGKLESMRDQLRDAINHSKGLLGESPLDEEQQQEEFAPTSQNALKNRLKYNPESGRLE